MWNISIVYSGRAINIIYYLTSYAKHKNRNMISHYVL